MVEATIDHRLVALLQNFDKEYYLDYMTRIVTINSACDKADFYQAGITSIESADRCGDIGFRGQFRFPVYVLLSHPICKFRLQRNYALRERFFISRLGLIPVFLSSLNRMTVLKLWGNRAGEFFNPLNAPLPDTDVACWEFPPSNRPVEYSSLNMLEQNGSDPQDAGEYLTGIFDRYLRLCYWKFPHHGFQSSAHFLFTREKISSFMKISKSIFLVEKIGNPQSVYIEQQKIETRQIELKGLNEHNGRYFFEHFSALMDGDLANEIMLHPHPQSLYINGMLVEIRHAGKRDSILTLRTDYVLSDYDIVQCLIGIVLGRKFSEIPNFASVEDIDEVRQKVFDIFLDIKHDLQTPTAVANSIDNLFEVCLSQMFPLVILDDRKVRIIHPLVWGFLKQWGLITTDNNIQHSILLGLTRLMSRTESPFRISLSEEMDFFTKMGIDKRSFIRSILNLKKTIVGYCDIEYHLNK